MQSARYSTPKSYPRSARAETRNRAKDELKRVINAVEKVRKWEKKWVQLKDSTIYIYKWVPVSGQATTASKSSLQKAAAALTALSNSNENSNDASNTNSQFGLNDESNTAFSENGFDSDSNQAISNQGPGGQVGSTDFSALVQEEKEAKGK